jgi:hypothetical protein
LGSLLPWYVLSTRLKITSRDVHQNCYSKKSFILHSQVFPGKYDPAPGA